VRPVCEALGLARSNVHALKSRPSAWLTRTKNSEFDRRPKRRIGASKSGNVAGFGYVEDERLAGANLLAVSLLVGPE
jgi:hypothetical protein